MVRTRIPLELEHFVAYAGSASIAIVGYRRQGAVRTIGLFWIHAGVLEYLQHFSTGRHPSIVDFSASAIGGFFRWLAAAFLVHRLRRDTYSDLV
jgi:hypothetical protein